MNVIWSKYVQGTKTLYYTRKLRFDDIFSDQYKKLFGLDESKHLKILEIGCGPGALAGALQRWYPNVEITAIDRDSEFIRFGSEHESGVNFMEGDATALPFENNTFDVTISNTVAEHIEPSKFYGEQLRVLKPGGICLVLSSRKGININPKCITFSEYEQQFWKKAQEHDDSIDRFAVCKYPMSEAEMPVSMAEHGFSNISNGFATIDLTPDNPKFSTSLALDMINANRYTALDGIESVLHTMPEYFTVQEVEEMKRLTNVKYDTRVEQYKSGEKQWDTNVSIIMILRGIK
ncbi:MAG: class I SAM-dependent methyltransferase [Clostridia bacterium]|nr:class I SAM-dependent methyltransferase [Clostridia bacterium]